MQWFPQEGPSGEPASSPELCEKPKPRHTKSASQRLCTASRLAAPPACEDRIRAVIGWLEAKVGAFVAFVLYESCTCSRCRSL